VVKYPTPSDFIKAASIAAIIYASYCIGEKVYHKTVTFLQKVLRDTKL